MAPGREEKGRDDDVGQAGLRQCMAKFAGIGGALRCRIATAHNGHTRQAIHRPGQKGRLMTQGIEQGGRIFNVEQRLGVGCVSQHQNAPVLRVGLQPIPGGFQRLFKTAGHLLQRKDLQRADHLAQARSALTEDLRWKAKRCQQFAC